MHFQLKHRYLLHYAAKWENWNFSLETILDFSILDIYINVQFQKPPGLYFWGFIYFLTFQFSGGEIVRSVDLYFFEISLLNLVIKQSL